MERRSQPEASCDGEAIATETNGQATLKPFDDFLWPINACGSSCGNLASIFLLMIHAVPSFRHGPAGRYAEDRTHLRQIGGDQTLAY